MNTFTADSNLQQHLSSLTGLTEVRAIDGRVLGFFSPCDEGRARAYAEASAQFDVEELEQRKASGDVGRSTVEVMAHLQSLG